MPKIELKTKIKANKEIVFDLSRSIDLHKISTEQTKEEAIEGKVSGLIGYGEWVTWRAKHFGIYQTLTSKIIEFERPHFFVDEMVKGAFASFRHQHNFKEFDYGTLMIYYFEYKSPLELLGKLADSLFLKKYMKTLLEKRNQTIKEFAESELWKQLLKT